MDSKNQCRLKMIISNCMDRLNPDVFVSLLLIRKASLPSRIEDFSDIWKSPNYHNRKQSEVAPWDIVVQMLDMPEEQFRSTIIRALYLLPFPTFLLEHLSNSIQNAKIEMSSIRKIIDLLSSPSMDNDYLSSIYEFFLSYVTRTELSATGDFYTPRQIVQLLIRFLHIQGGNVYDPCCGSGTLLCETAEMCEKTTPIHLFGQALTDKDYQICKINCILRNLYTNLGKEPANTLLVDLHSERQFPYIIANVPFNSKDWYDVKDYSKIVSDPRWVYGIPPHSNANYAWLQHIIYHLDRNGRAVVILPNGALTTQKIEELQIREQILKKHLIESVISLPGGLFYNTKVPCSIWIINKQHQSDKGVLLINACHILTPQRKELEEEELERILTVVRQYREGTLMEKKRTPWYAIVSLDELVRKQFNLSPNLYTMFEELPLEPMIHNHSRFLYITDALKDLLPDEHLKELIVQWKSVQTAAQWEKASLTELYDICGGVTKSSDYFNCGGTPMVGVRDVIHQMYLSENFASQVNVSPAELHKYAIHRGDILMNRSSETIDKLACCSLATDDISAVYGSFIKRLRPKYEKRVDSFYALAYFHSALYRQEIKRISPVYTTRANINMQQLSEIPCYYPDMETQNRIGQTVYDVSNYQQTCCDIKLNKMLEEFIQLLIEQHITYPIQILKK